MKNFISSCITILISAMIIAIGIGVFTIAFVDGLFYTFGIKLSFCGIYLLSIATILAISYIFSMFKS